MFKILLKKDLYSLTLAKLKNTKNKTATGIISILLVAYLMFVFGFMFYNIFSLGTSFKTIGLMYSSITGSVLILFSVLFEANDLIYKSKDLKLLNSLPINGKTIFYSKLVAILSTAYAYFAVVMLPVFLVYFIVYGFSFIALIYMIIAFISLPLIPFGLGIILGMLLNIVTRKIKHKNLITTLSYFIFFILIMCFSFMLQMDFTGLADSNSVINNILFPFYSFGYAISANGIYILYTLLISLAIGTLFSFISSLAYNKTSKTYNEQALVKKKNEKIQSQNIYLSFFKKETKRYFSSPLYILNTLFGAIIAIFYAFIYVLGAGDDVAAISKDIGFLLAGGITIFCIMLCCTSCSSLSLEGKNIKLLKTLPIDFNKVLLTKIIFNIVLILPFGLISAIILAAGYNFGFSGNVAIILAPICGIIFTAFAGMLANVLLPKFDATSDAVIIKRSAATFMGMFLPVLIVFLLFLCFWPLRDNIGIYNIAFIVEAIILILSAICYFVMKKVVKKKFITY